MNKFETLSLVQLKDLAKALGKKSTSIMRKAELVEYLTEMEKANARIPDSELNKDKSAGEKNEEGAEPVKKKRGRPRKVREEAPEEAKQEEKQENAAESGTPEPQAEEKPAAFVRKTTVVNQVEPPASIAEQAKASAQTPAAEQRPVQPQNAYTEQGQMRQQVRYDNRTQYNNRYQNYQNQYQHQNQANYQNQYRNQGQYQNAPYQNQQYQNRYQQNNYQQNGYQQNNYQQNGYQQGNYIPNNYQQGGYQQNGYQQGYQDRRYAPEQKPTLEELDSGNVANGILEVTPDGFGFIRCENYLPGENDIYVSPAQIRRFNLKTGDIITGNIKIRQGTEKFAALLYITKINDLKPEDAVKRYNFEDMTPIFPNERLRLENSESKLDMRIVDIISPIGKGQRGMIVSPPKAGKTTLLKHIAKSITKSYPEINLIILLIDERPEEVTDIKEEIEGENVEVIYSTFDELPEHHKRVSEMVLERAKRLVEHQKDVVILLDSITRLARAYNLTVAPSGRTLSGGLDPAALHMPKKFFGAARNMREGGSLTVLATALVDTGSRMDDVVFEEFKGTGNMELVLDRKLSEKRVFPAIDIIKSGTRNEDRLLTPSELEASYKIRKALSSSKAEENAEQIIDLFSRTENNTQFCNVIKRNIP